MSIQCVPGPLSSPFSFPQRAGDEAKHLLAQ